MRLLILSLALTALPAFAQDTYAFREGDEALAADRLQDRLSGRTLTFFDDGVSEYYDDGRYTYTYAENGGTAYGYWRIAEDGAICVDFVNGFARCDHIVQSGGRLILLDARGERYPIRPE